MTLDATISGTNSNSYVTVEESDSYFASRLHSEKWTGVEDKEAALITASRMLDWNLKFQGYPTISAQSMCFPRLGIIRSDGREVSGLIIPTEVKFATFELALAFAEEDRTADEDMAGLQNVKAGPLSVTAFGNGIESTKSPVIPNHIRSMLSDFLLSISVVRLMRA